MFLAHSMWFTYSFTEDLVIGQPWFAGHYIRVYRDEKTMCLYIVSTVIGICIK